VLDAATQRFYIISLNWVIALGEMQCRKERKHITRIKSRIGGGLARKTLADKRQAVSENMDVSSRSYRTMS
jgi:hypothetical protein